LYQQAVKISEFKMVSVPYKSGKMKGICVSVAGLLLTACAHNNALLQSSEANSTDSIDQINLTLDEALKRPNQLSSNYEFDAIPDSVMSALTPDMNASAMTQKFLEPTRFDIGVNQLPAKDFFAGLIEGSKRNMVVHPDVKGLISLQLKDVTVSEVLEITKDIYGYDYEEKGSLIKVFPVGLRTQFFAINYLNIQRNGDSETRVSSGQITQNTSGSGASSSSDSDSGSSNSGAQSSGFGTRIATQNNNDFWSKLESTLKLIIGNREDHSVVITPSTGMVVVRASSDILATVQQYLESSELILQRQVILEAKILEVSLNDGYQQGIDWSFSSASSALDSSGNPKRGINLGQAAQQIVNGDVGGVFASTIKLGNFDTTINLLGTQGNVQVLSSPRIATVNNQKAVIKVGSDEYFVTDIDFESNSDSNSTSTDIDLTPFFSGIALDVTPQISKDGKIILHVHPTISKVEDQQKIISVGGQEIDLPLAFSTIRESDSVITAENGQIVVIGGLIQNRSEDKNASVPFLGDIPLLGELFKQKGQASQKTELVILIRPTVTNDSVITEDIRSSRRRFGEFREQMAAPTETLSF